MTVYDPFFDSDLKEGPHLVVLTVCDTGQGIDHCR
jgi:hypothetical protein